MILKSFSIAAQSMPPSFCSKLHFLMFFIWFFSFFSFEIHEYILLCTMLMEIEDT